MEVELHNGLVKQLEVDGVRCEEFGIEFSDRYCFFTLTEIPRNCSIELVSKRTTDFESIAKYRVQLVEGLFELDVVTNVDFASNKIVVKSKLEALQNSIIQDFVLRFKFIKDDIDNVEIVGKQFMHNDSEKYRQFPTNSVKIMSKKGSIIKLTRTNEVLGNPDDYSPEMYVRDLPGWWIVHSRFFPTFSCELLWFRWINRYFSLTFTYEFSKFLAKLPFFKKFFWYRKERRGRKGLHMQLIGMLKLPKGKSISQTVEVEFG